MTFMGGSGSRGGDGGREESKVLVYEYVTGGGLADRELPASWAIEGAAMRRAIVGDFAAVPGVRVVTTLDSRLPVEALPGVGVRIISDRDGCSFESLAAEADYTVLIAPETDGILSGLTRAIERVGGRSLGSGDRAIDLVGDKARLAHHFVGCGIPTPPTRMVGPTSRDLPAEWEGPIVVKPRSGAGSVDTVVVRDRRCPPWVGRSRLAVAQPFLVGEPMSASFLVDRDGHPTLLAVGRQRIDIDPEGRISYGGGVIPAKIDACPAAVEEALASVVAAVPLPGLRGFVGVDFLLHAHGRATILEINPRPTTSYVGLSHLAPAGTVAGAWLAAVSTGLDGTGWPDRLRSIREHSRVAFDADGSIRHEEMNS
jgi:predicted ATP-grasp superfamily ATP-dependent carboligase